MSTSRFADSVRRHFASNTCLRRSNVRAQLAALRSRKVQHQASRIPFPVVASTRRKKEYSCTYRESVVSFIQSDDAPAKTTLSNSRINLSNEGRPMLLIGD